MSMSLHKKPSKFNYKLLRIAGITGVVVSSGCLLMQWFMNRRLRQSEYYRTGTEIFMNYKPIVSLFGEPIYFGNPDLGDKENWSTEMDAQFKIPIKGQKNRGVLWVKANRLFDQIDQELELNNSNPSSSHTAIIEPPNAPMPSHGWSITKLEVTIDNRPGEKVVVPLESLENKSESAARS